MGLDETLPSMAKIVQEFISDRKNPKKYIFSMRSELNMAVNNNSEKP